jgi:hypothetical protein
VDLPPLVSVEATGVCIPIGNSEVLVAAFINLQAGLGAMLTSLSYEALDVKSILAGDLNAKHLS